MNLRLKIMATAVIAALSATNAYAIPATADGFLLNPGYDGDTPLAFLGFANDLNTVTSTTNPAKFVNFNANATSIYIQPVATTATPGFLTNGDILTFRDKIQTPIVISSLNSAGGPLSPFVDSLEGFNTTWQLKVDYDIQGTATVAVPAGDQPINMTTTLPLLGGVPDGTVFPTPNTGLVPSFTPITSIISLYINNPVGAVPDLVSGQKILEMKLISGGFLIGNLELTGQVDYSWLAGSGYTAAQMTAIKNFFTFASDGKSFYDLWALDPSAAHIFAPTWQVNTNVEPNLIPRQDTLGSNTKPGLTPGACPDTTPDSFCRTTSLNVDIAFQRAVPEPDTILMLGIGMMGLGFSIAKRHSKKLAA
jgi:hypothetical protein